MVVYRSTGSCTYTSTIARKSMSPAARTTGVGGAGCVIRASSVIGIVDQTWSASIVRVLPPHSAVTRQVYPGVGAFSTRVAPHPSAISAPNEVAWSAYVWLICPYPFRM